MTANREAALKQFCADESGQDLIEYALIAGVVGLGTIAALKTVATNIGTVFGTVGTTLNSAL